MTSAAADRRETAPERGGGALRRALLGGLHLAVLWAFAVAQPLFSVLEKTPEFFAVRGSPPVDIAVFAIGLVAIPPLVLTVVELIAGLASRALAQALHLAFFAVVTALFLMQVVEELVTVSGPVAIALALVGAAGLTVAYARTAALRTFMTVLSPAPLVCLLIFLFASPVSKLVLPEQVEAFAGTPDARRAPVVMVILDEFPVISMLDRHDRIDRGRLPNFAALAADSTWYRNATTVSGYTEQSVPSIVTSRLHRRQIVGHIAEDRAQNMFTLLRGSHRMNVIETRTNLCPQSVCKHRPLPFWRRMGSLAGDLGVVTGHVVLPADLSSQVPSIADTWQNFANTGQAQAQRADERGRTAGEAAPGGLVERFVASVGRAARRPSLNWLHVELPHRPFTYLASGTAYNGLSLPGLRGDRWMEDPWPVTQAYARDLVQTAYVDRLIGRLVRTMKRAGIYRKSAIVITSDHGAAFTPGCNRRQVTPCSFDQIAGVPMIVKAPGQLRGRISDKHVQTTDVMPTIADLLDVTVPWKVEGHSMFDPRYHGAARVSVARSPPISRSVPAYLAGRERAVRHKLALFGTGSGTQGLFDIGPDPQLIGRPVAGLAAGTAPGATLRLDQPGAFERVRPRSGFVPALVRGLVDPPDGPEQQGLALAVNGRIVAVSRTYRATDRNRRFAALVPEPAFRAGRNEVAVYAVRRSGTGLTLARIPRRD